MVYLIKQRTIRELRLAKCREQCILRKHSNPLLNPQFTRKALEKATQATAATSAYRFEAGLRDSDTRYSESLLRQTHGWREYAETATEPLGHPYIPESAPNTRLPIQQQHVKNYVLRGTYAFRRLASSVLCGWVLTPVPPSLPRARKSGIGPMCWRQHCPTIKASFYNSAARIENLSCIYISNPAAKLVSWDQILNVQQVYSATLHTERMTQQVARRLAPLSGYTPHKVLDAKGIEQRATPQTLCHGDPRLLNRGRNRGPDGLLTPSKPCPDPLAIQSS